MWNTIYRDFSDLSKSEQLKLFEVMKQDLSPEERKVIAKMLQDIRKIKGLLRCLVVQKKATDLVSRINFFVSYFLRIMKYPQISRCFDLL